MKYVIVFALIAVLAVAVHASTTVEPATTAAAGTPGTGSTEQSTATQTPQESTTAGAMNIHMAAITTVFVTIAAFFLH